MSQRARLDKSVVVDAAVDLVNLEGIEGLTLTRLAKKLGVQTPSLYNHIDGLPGLKRELALTNVHRLGDRLEKAAIGKSRPEALRQVAHAYRGYIKGNAGLYTASLKSAGSRAIKDDILEQSEEHVVEIGMAVVSSFGLQGDDGLHAIRGLRSVVHGFATLEITGGFGLPLDCDESFSRLVEILIAGLEHQRKG
jgi:AcrR family transcriptional regulator